MVTKKTRLMSGLVAVLMLVSMFTAFVIPVSAETTSNYDEVAGTALVDKSGLKNINKGFVSGVKEYQVTDRAGVEVIADAFDNAQNGSHNELNNYKFYQMADIDMGWEPFEGIAGYTNDGTNYSFRGNWDGNGFVIKNLYINHSDTQKDIYTGFFNRIYSNGDHHTIQNLAIASGIVIGRDHVGSIAGNVHGNNASTHTSFYNCWSAAIVVGTGTNGVGGLVGNINGDKMTKDFGMYNCAFYGTVYSANSHVAGLIAWETTVASFQMKNCYMGGELIAGANSSGCRTYVDSADSTKLYAYDEEVHGYNAFLRADASSTTYKAANFANNYYLASCGQKSYADALNDFDGTVTVTTDETTGAETYSKKGNLALNDGGKGVESSANLAASLNEGITNNTGTGYTVKYSDSTAGYPVLTYYDSENNVIAKRLPADDGFVASKGSLAAKSTLFKDVAALQKGGIAVEGKKLANLEVATAEDLMALCLITVGTNAAIYTNGKILFTADIDASKQTMIPGFPYYPAISAGYDLKVSVDGQNHIIYNYHNYAMKVGNEPAGGLIYRLGSANVSNLGMVNAKASFDNAASWKTASGYAHPSLMVQQTVENAVVNMENCFAIGDIYLLATNGEIVNENDFGGLIGCIRRGTGTVNISNCWADTTVHKVGGATQKARAIGTVATVSGSTPAAVVTWNNVAYIASALPFSSGSIANGNTSIDLNCQPYLDIEDSSDRYLAAYLNKKNAANATAALWTVEQDTLAGATITKFGDETNAIRTVAAVKDFGSGTENVETYLKVGEKYTVTDIANYSLKENSGYSIGQVITVANQDYAIPYELTGVETKPVEDIIADLGRYDMNLFANDGADMAAVLAEAKAAKEQAEAALDSGDKAQIKAANDAVQAVWAKYEANVTAEDRVLKGVYPYLPGYADIDIYKDLEGYDAKNLAISDRDDWIAAVKEGAKNFSGITLHLTGNIDMKNDATDLKPLSFGSTFKGVLDGHDYAFTNIKMEMTATAATHHGGLVSVVDGGAVVRNVGIANGSLTFEYTANVDGCSFGAIAGIMNGGGKIQRCWNAASVTVTMPAGNNTNHTRVAGIVGAGYNNSIVDSCYNLGTVTSPRHAAGINDWAQTGGKTYNSFNAGALVAPGEKGLVRYNDTNHDSNTANSISKNNYSLGAPLASSGSAEWKSAMNVAPHSNMDPAAYASGELAWHLNNGYQENYGVKTYWTLENGKTVYGTADNQTVRVVLNFENREDEYVYLNKNDATAELAITYGEAEGNNKPIFTPAEGELSTISGSTLTYNAEDGDVEVNVTFEGNGIDYINYLKAVEVWGARNPDYYAPNGEKTAQTVFAELKALREAADATQATVDAKADEMNAFAGKYAGYPNLPTASEYEKYTDAPGFLIKTNADLLAAGENSAKFTAEQTLYLEADLDLTGVAFKGFKDLKASFEGNEHTISNFTMETVIAPAYNDPAKDTGFFMDFYGAYIKNLTMENAKVSTDNRDIAVLISTNKSKDLTIENVHLVDCTVTLKNKLYDANSISGLLAVSDAGSGVVNITNCTVKGSTIESVEGTKNAGNLGFVIGVARSQSTFNITDVLVEDSTIGTVGTGGAGFAIGAVEGTGHVIMNNVGVLNNKRINSTVGKQNRGLLISYVKQNAEIDLSNIVILGNNQDAANQAKTNTDYEWDLAFYLEDTGSEVANLEASSYMNIYTDKKNISNNAEYGTSENLHYSITPAQYGEIAFAMNAVGTAQKWEVDTDGGLVVDTNGEGLPAKVEFVLAEVDYETKGEASATVYTDNEGMLIGLTDEMIDELKEKAAWPADVDWDGPYTVDTVVTGAPYPVHNENHATHLVQDADGVHHYIVCDHEEAGGAVCGHSEKVGCDFKYKSTATEGTKPEDAKHKLVCECGNEQAEVYCCDGGEENFTVVTEPATPEKEGSVTSSCKLCGYTHVKTLIKLVGITIDAEKAYAGESGEVLVKLNNNHGLSGAVVEITYDSDLMTLKNAVMLLPEGFPGGENNQLLYPNTTEPDADGMVKTTVTMVIYGTHAEENLLKLTFDYNIDAVAEGDLSVQAPLEIKVPDVSDYDLESFDVTPYSGNIEIFDIVYGDIDDDKVVTIIDAILMLRHINGDQNLEEIAPNINLVAADIDDDGEVELEEVITVLQYLNHSIDAIVRG